MRTLHTDENNDMFLSNRGFAFVYDADAVCKVSEQVVQTQRGELQLDITRGIPYFETVFSSSRNSKAWAAEMTKALSAIPNVTGVDSFKFQIKENTIKYVALLRSTFGKVTVNG